MKQRRVGFRYAGLIRLGGIVLVMFFVLCMPVGMAVADNSPAMGGSSNWDADGGEWQYDGTNGTNSEIWTYWMSGTDSAKTVGPGEEDFTGSSYEETGQSVYNGKCALSAAMTRSAGGGLATVNTWSPMDVYYDKQTLDARERWQKSTATAVGETWSKVWNINHSGDPSTRDLSGGESWSYNETTDPATSGWGDSNNSTGQDAGNQDNEAYTVTVSSGTSNVTVTAGTFACYTVTKDSATRSDIVEYWDEDGALTSMVKSVDNLSFDNPNTLTLRYHDWPGMPSVTMCDSGESDKSTFLTTDNVYVTGHWATLMSSVDSDNLYDIWVGSTNPGSGTALSGWGTKVAADVNVGPQSGTNEPGTFSENLSTISAGTYYLVLDDGDGTYHADNNTFEGYGDAWGSQNYYTGSTSYDDGISAVFYVVPTVASCDSGGSEDSEFLYNETVYASGSGYSASTAYDVYIYPSPIADDTALGSLGTSPSDSGWKAADITTDGSGDFSATSIWDTTGFGGSETEWDVIVVPDGDTTFNEEDDACDTLGSTAGMVAPVPEIATIVLVSLGLLAIGGFVWYRRRQRLSVVAA